MNGKGREDRRGGEGRGGEGRGAGAPGDGWRKSGSLPAPKGGEAHQPTGLQLPPGCRGRRGGHLNVSPASPTTLRTNIRFQSFTLQNLSYGNMEKIVCPPHPHFLNLEIYSTSPGPSLFSEKPKILWCRRGPREQGERHRRLERLSWTKKEAGKKGEKRKSWHPRKDERKQKGWLLLPLLPKGKPHAPSGPISLTLSPSHWEQLVPHLLASHATQA